MWELWFIILISLIITSMWTNSKGCIKLMISCILPLIYSYFCYQLIHQCLILILSMIFVTVITRHHHFHLPHFFTPTTSSLYALIGKTGVVTHPLGHHPLESGTIKVDGQTWPAFSCDQSVILKGQLIKIKAISGIHLIVQSHI